MKSTYDKILANREIDLTTNLHGKFSPKNLEDIYNLAKKKFDDLIKVQNPKNDEDLQKIWHEIVVNFHANNYWGYKKISETESGQISNSKKKKELSLTTFIPVFLIPIIITKTAILYFGIMWGNYPGEGYGYGFFAAVAFAVCNFSFFLWRNRGYKED